MKEHTKKQAAETVARNVCLLCGQAYDATRIVRGCHERCYRRAVRATEAEQLSEHVLELLPKGGGRPKGSSKKWIKGVGE